MQNTKLVFILLTCLVFMGCKSRDKQPELKDPIYLDIISEQGKAESKLKIMEKQLESLKEIVAKLSSRSVDKQVKQKQIRELNGYIQNLKQKEQYLKIRADQRRVYARRDYNVAFDKGEEWPDPKEYEAYKLNNKLHAASKNWNDRVPKKSGKSSSADRLEGMKLKE